MATGRSSVLDQPMGTFSIESFNMPDPAPKTVLLRQDIVRRDDAFGFQYELATSRGPRRPSSCRSWHRCESP
jgi:hypothetical protein